MEDDKTWYVLLSHSPFFGLFGSPIGQKKVKFVLVCSPCLIPAHLVLKNPRMLWNLMQQNQRNGVEEFTYATFGFDKHNALI